MTNFQSALQRFNAAVDRLEAGVQNVSIPQDQRDFAAEVEKLRAREDKLLGALQSARTNERKWADEAKTASGELSAAIREIKTLLED